VPYSIAVDEARRVVVVTIQGVVDAELAMPMVSEARKASAPRGLPILYDFRLATPGKISTTDIFWFPRNIPALTSPEAKRLRIASLHDDSPAQQAIGTFWETTFRNVGLQARAFRDEAEAFAWLAEKPPA
jgi:hypothetical protein